MNSNDVVITINGQRFVIEGTTLKPSESTFEQEVLRRFDNIESRVGKIESELVVIHHDIATLTTSVYWVFGAIGIFLAALGIPAVISTIIQAFKKNESPASNETGTVKMSVSQFTELLMRPKQ